MAVSETQAIACTLDERELPARRRAIQDQLVARAAEVRELPDGYRLRFADGAAMRAAVEEFVALERECCSFLRFEIDDDGPDGALTLTLTGPEGTVDVIGAAMAAPTPRHRLDPRWLRSGLAVGAVALVCCFGPTLLLALGVTGAAALAGGALAEVAAIGAVSTPLLVWIWRRRPADDGCGC